jgi:hypothetical protein
LSIKKIGGPGQPEITGPSGPRSGDRAQEVREPFDGLVERTGPAEGQASASIEGVLVEAVEAVRRGDLDPDQALESILEGSRSVLETQLPAEVDMEDVLEYIRETLEGDPTFMALLKGTVPSGS